MLVFPSRWRRPSAPRSLGPRVARVRRPRAARWATAAHVTPPIRRVMEHVEVHVGEVRTLDELAEVAGLSRFHFARRFRDETGEPPWAFVRRKRAEHARRLLQPEHLLQPNRQHGRIGIRIVERADGAAGDRHVRRREPVEIGAGTGRGKGQQDHAEVEPRQVRQPRHPGEVRAEPDWERVEQRIVRDVGPRLAEVVLHERQPLAEPRRLLRPRQRRQPGLADALDEPGRDEVRGRGRDGRGSEDDGAEPRHALRPNAPGCAVPHDRILRDDLIREECLDLVRVERSGEEDTRAARPVVQVTDGEERGVGEGLVAVEAGRTALAEAVARALGRLRHTLRDAVGVGEGKK